MTGLLDGKIVFVTGPARGIGTEVARGVGTRGSSAT
jgi:NAD(P)-dependent dehydrogenase (short-subunit alcohol dehydrogenase family)